MFIERQSIDALKKWAANPERKPLLLEGARQVGKTALLQKFGAEDFPRCYYFNFERDSELERIFSGSLEPKRILEDLELKVGKAIDPFKSLIIFDEVQECERALTSLKYFEEDLKGSFIACAGSLLGITLSSSSFPVGKVNRISLYPLSFSEFVHAHNQEALSKALADLTIDIAPSPFVTDKLWDLMLAYFICGGLPEVVLGWLAGKSKLEKVENIKEAQRRIYRDYLADIAKHSGSESAMHIETVFRSIPQQLAREIDGTASKFQFKGVVRGKKSFEELRGPIDWLCRAGMIHQIYIAEKANPPLSAYCKDNRFKLYLFDLGILRHLSSFNPEDLLNWGDNHYKGFYAENFMLLQLLSAGAQLPKAWREGDSEIEFVNETSLGTIPIDVKSGSNRRSRSLSVFCNRYQPKQAYVMAGKTFSNGPSGAIATRPLFAVPKACCS